MIEHIGCKRCDSPNCKGCNMLTLERMLNSGKFNCLMNENRTIDRNAEVEPVVHGRWEERPTGRYGQWQSWCTACGKHSGIGGIESNRHKPYCPNCGAKMDGGNNDVGD